MSEQRERYVDARELARLMGVSERTIKRMVVAGMPSETWGMARTRRFLPSQAVAWAQSKPRANAQPAARPDLSGDSPEGRAAGVRNRTATVTDDG